ncbi:MAG: hypothetical protein J2P17_33045, partial [Mycobacterium sp.]|nr:hypothetical protein [Mycobacterium sp.]
TPQAGYYLTTGGWTWNNSLRWDLPDGVILGNLTGITNWASPISLAALTSRLPLFTSVADGIVPASGGGSVNFLRADGAWAMPPVLFPNINIVEFNGPQSSVYVPSPGLAYAVVECFGMGGNGGGVATGSATVLAIGCGGGSGGYSRSTLTAAQIGASQNVVVGNNPGTPGAYAGPTWFGPTQATALVLAYGGQNSGQSNGATVFSGPGNGGQQGIGEIAQAGTPGHTPSILPIGTTGTWLGYSGQGGSLVGGGGPSVNQTGGFATAGSNATGVSGGGSGAIANLLVATLPGGLGGGGRCVITEFIF